MLQHECAHRDLLVFVDNEAAVSALIRGGSRVADAAWLVELFHALALRLGSRAWIEWTDSESNPSDDRAKPAWYPRSVDAAAELQPARRQR